jgi:hypothetical protein
MAFLLQVTVTLDNYKIISIFCLCDLNMVGYQVSSYGIQLDNKYAGFFNLKLLLI